MQPKIFSMLDISNLHSEASLRANEWRKFFSKNKLKLKKMDRLIHQLHDEVSSEINCLDCGNCCRSLGPMISEKDIDNLSKSMRMRPSDFIDKFLRKDEDNDFIFNQSPCPFLGDDNYCSVYENRPTACHEYPHTDRNKFYQIYALTIKNAYICPIAFEVLDRLMDEMK